MAQPSLLLTITTHPLSREPFDCCVVLPVVIVVRRVIVLAYSFILYRHVYFLLPSLALPLIVVVAVIIHRPSPVAATIFLLPLPCNFDCCVIVVVVVVVVVRCPSFVVVSSHLLPSLFHKIITTTGFT
jgi:hypothetical protein